MPSSHFERIGDFEVQEKVPSRMIREPSRAGPCSQNTLLIEKKTQQFDISTGRTVGILERVFVRTFSLTHRDHSTHQP